MNRSMQIFVFVLAVCTAIIQITNLVFTIIIYNDQKMSRLDSEHARVVVSTSRPYFPTTKQTSLTTPVPGNVSKSEGFKDAAEQLLRGIDWDIDPCDDFYAFTCNNYLNNIQIPNGTSRIGTYDEAQDKVFHKIARSIEKMNISKVSSTEGIVKHIFTLCSSNFVQQEADKSQIIYEQLKKDLGDVPMFNSSWSKMSLDEVLKVVGRWESKWSISTLFLAYVTADDGDSSRPALYLRTPQLPRSLDYFIKPQFLIELQGYRKQILALFRLFAKNVKADSSRIEKSIDDIVQFQVQLAMNFVPSDLLKNVRLQYNNYTITQFASSYPSIGRNYFDSLLADILTPDRIESQEFVITQPRYYRALDGMLQDHQFKMTVLVDYLCLQYIISNSDFIGDETKKIVRAIKADSFKPRQKNYSNELFCVATIQDVMPYGTGYIYIKTMTDKERTEIVADVDKQVDYVIKEFLNNVDQLTWMTLNGKNAVHKKAENVIKNIGYPYWFEFNNSKAIDEYHVYYQHLGNVTDYFVLQQELLTAYQKTENLGLLVKETIDRRNFQDSPASVNAWYSPELNSITIPRATLNQPYYRLDFPQSYNYAGNGGTVGHELTHGFDSDGVQFNEKGNMANCDSFFCTILDKNSTIGFMNMAECVISQYNEQCCPLKAGNVHCANGVNTQGENMADIGGQYAAYKAYRRYIEEERKGIEEDLLPGLEMFTGNQIFWITYGFSWCMKQTKNSLVYQLLTNEHAPGSCRVNQVMQDLPEFAQDFHCKPNTRMFPDQKCSVWR